MSRTRMEIAKKKTMTMRTKMKTKMMKTMTRAITSRAQPRAVGAGVAVEDEVEAVEGVEVRAA